MPLDAPLCTVGALYPAVRRGLAADVLAAHALGAHALPVCTAIAIAGRGRVTDFTEVPEDTVRAQLEHVAEVASPAALSIGVLASRGTAAAVLEAARRWDVPTVLSLDISGPDGETVLSPGGVSVVMDRLGIPDVVVLSATDAELVSGGEIASLDDAQVAAQRIVRRGARAVVIKCRALPARHFESASGDGGPGRYAADLFYDGNEFALFEAPYLEGVPTEGASSAFAVALACALARPAPMEEALQQAKAYTTDAIRYARPIGGHPSLAYFEAPR